MLSRRGIFGAVAGLFASPAVAKVAGPEPAMNIGVDFAREAMSMYRPGPVRWVPESVPYRMFGGPIQWDCEVEFMPDGSARTWGRQS